MVKRKILWDPNPELFASVTATITSGLEDLEKDLDQGIGKVHRSGNGHKILKVRDLQIHEKNTIETQLFIPNNGQITADLCVEFKTQKLPGEVSIFQVTGYVTCLHGKVARGKLRVGDIRSYENFIKAHRSLWKTYDSDRYKAMRDRATQHRTPQFAAYPATRRKISVS
jgi:hypothetical protein